MSYKILPTPPFERELKRIARKYPSVKKDMAALAVALLDNPRLGTSLGNNCFKIRMVIFIERAREIWWSQNNHLPSNCGRNNILNRHLR